MEEGVAILLVRAGRQTFGVPADQVARLEPVRPGGASGPRLAAGLGALAPEERGSHVLITKGDRSWEVEAVGDLRSVPLAAVRRLPPFLSRRASRAVFGAALEGDRLVLLLDVERLGPQAT